MSEFIIYLLKANVALSLFYLGYKFWLAQLTFYKINRFYLFFALLFSAIYPIIPIHEWFVTSKEIPVNLLITITDWQQLQLPEEAAETRSIFSIAYWISVGIFGFLFLIKLLGIGRIHLKSVPAKWKMFHFRETMEIISPFSFWTNIYINPLLHAEEEYEKIFKHEQVHVRQLHSLDMIASEIGLVFFWYNPICWMIRKAIQENMEFIADQQVLSSGINIKSYQYSLIHISTLSAPPQLGNHFNFKNLKKRMIMMNKKPSSKMHIGKYIFIFPAVVFGSLIFGSSQAFDSNKLPDIYENYLTQDEKKQEKRAASVDTLPEGKNPMVRVDGRKVHYSFIQSLDKEKIKSVNVIKGEKAVERFGEDGKNGVIEIITHLDNSIDLNVDVELDHDISMDIQVDIDSSEFTEKNNKESVQGTGLNTSESKDASLNLSGEIAEDVLILVNGKKIHRDQMDNIAPAQIESVSVYKGVNAEEHFGKKGKDGVIEIFLKGDKP
jgi:hypothetical protein